MKEKKKITISVTSEDKINCLDYFVFTVFFPHNNLP